MFDDKLSDKIGLKQLNGAEEGENEMVRNKGINMSTIKQENRASILKILKTNGAASRKDIADIIELTPAAVTIIVNEMIQEGIIKEVGQLEEKDKRAGRRKMLLNIEYSYKHVIGINIESDKVSIGIANLNGQIIHHHVMQLDKTIAPTQFLKKIASTCMKILWKQNIVRENVIGVGVGIVGRVDLVSGSSKHAYGLWREEVEVKRTLEHALSIPVVIDNNVRALALAEMEYASEGNLDNMLFVKCGPGIGSAMIINREIYYGTHSMAGEIGHMVMDDDGPICKCGQRGCLEALASQEAMIKRLLNDFSKENMPILYALTRGCRESISFANMELAYESGETMLQSIIDEATAYLARGIVNVIRVYDPKKVILYGEIFKWPLFHARVLYRLRQIISDDILHELIVISSLESESDCIGGIALAIRTYFYKIGGMNTHDLIKKINL